MEDIRKIGIIGIGPRGGYSLERLIIELVKQNSLSNIQLSLFEATGNFGNGQVYDLNQISSNWINITERILELEKRKVINSHFLKIAPFPSYHEWIHKDFITLAKDETDTYPPRSQIGEYLSQRFQSLIKPLIQSNIVSLYEEETKNIKWLNNGKIQISTDANSYEEFDEVLLTIGHQLTEPSQQILNWDQFAINKENINLFKAPYPVVKYLHHKNLHNKSTVGIRGFGLAMIDVVRAMAEKFGNFAIKDEKSRLCNYYTKEQIKVMFIPFSLDGLPPVPKPLNAQIDKSFQPSEDSILKFEKQIGNKQIQKEAESPHFLISAFAPITASIYTRISDSNDQLNTSLQEIEKLITQWLEDQSIEHPLFIPIEQPAEESMQNFVDMAIGKIPISLDYCIGQVWRHCQPTIYKALSFNECSNKVFAKIIALDESTKRFSYGPPVESIQQLLALVDVGILNLDMVNNPNIELTKKGWRFHLSDKSTTATIMIDSVLDSPNIKSVMSPIVRNMLDDGLMKVVHDDLGIVIDEYGYLISKNENTRIPIALLGRLAKGTIIGVDAILECFGSRPCQWAKQAASNHTKWLDETI